APGARTGPGKGAGTPSQQAHHHKKSSMSSYFDAIAPIQFRGPGSTDPLSFRHYDKNRIVLGKRMEDHLRLAVCYWHNFVWTGLDPFGGATFERPWFEGGSPMELARMKADA